jgi:predicted transcriptional regulator
MAEDKKQNKQGQINIELDEKVAEGIYSNLAIINHSVSEFVVDFVSIMPGIPKNKVKARIILTPQHAKRLLKALGENIKRFENAHGEIKDYDQPPIPLNFGPTGQA